MDGDCLRIEEAVEETGGKTVAAADAIKDIELAGRRLNGIAVDPGDGAPLVAVCRMDLTKRRRNDFDIGQLFGDLVHFSSQVIELLALAAVVCFGSSSAIVLDSIRKQRALPK